MLGKLRQKEANYEYFDNDNKQDIYFLYIHFGEGRKVSFSPTQGWVFLEGSARIP